MLAALDEYTGEVQEAVEEQSDRIAEEIYTDIVILNYSTPTNMTYDFSTGKRVDKWAAEKKGESTNPPSTGPLISGESDFSPAEYDAIDTSNDNQWADTAIDDDMYATHHFLFTISEDPATIYNLSVLWEGYGTQHPSYVYIWNYDASDWELIGIGTLTEPDNIISKDLTVNSANPPTYIDDSGYLHLVATSYESGGKQKLYTDYVRVFVSTGGLWVKNIGETTLDPSYAVLFDNYEYVEPSTYSATVNGDYWDPTEVLRIAYNAPTSISHLFKVTTGNGVSDSYYYAP